MVHDSRRWTWGNTLVLCEPGVRSDFVAEMELEEEELARTPRLESHRSISPRHG
jgi:hypothetical protein